MVILVALVPFVVVNIQGSHSFYFVCLYQVGSLIQSFACLARAALKKPTVETESSEFVVVFALLVVTGIGIEN